MEALTSTCPKALVLVVDKHNKVNYNRNEYCYQIIVTSFIMSSTTVPEHLMEQQTVLQTDVLHFWSCHCDHYRRIIFSGIKIGRPLLKQINKDILDVLKCMRDGQL